MTNKELRLALCLSGGNALGAYQAGFCGALLRSGAEFPVIACTSVGSIVGAVIAGNRGARRAEALAEFWQAARQTVPWPTWRVMGLRRMSLVHTILYGHSRLFRPKVPGLLSVLAGVDIGRSLYDRAPMRELVSTLVDFELLNDGTVHLLLTGVDAESGEVVTFDSRRQRIGVDHLMAATAFPVLFDPVQIDGRWIVDAGLRRNLPLDGVPQGKGLATLALDLFPLRGGLPDTLTGMAARAQDIALAGQSAEAIERFLSRGDGLLVHAVPDDPSDMTATKGLDYSEGMLAARLERGAADAAALLAGWDGLPKAGIVRLQAGHLAS